ncbi:hypothetical protein DFQ27_005874 [Actinomortierella ambigua]|uniref:Nucleoside diphosphate kinase n=1 Tax=Actinomortierella ambigua TaxID=1343610 RepID=A0A9P6U2B2_9FUNG|nr:hypothetical protein DFQ26_009873 [Actinomortierella ambigua]KAG0256149.1 hypothetical protein DFQ27_005874 [Actinomortierella ambigua]
MTQRTYAMLKPDVASLHRDAIVKMVTEGGFKIVAQKEYQFTLAAAQEFYAEHEGRPFFDDLTTWISSAPVYAMVLEKDNAIVDWRTFIGPTNSEKARAEAPDSIRAKYGKDGSHNAVHGSDSVESAKREILLVFPELA